MNTFVYKKRKQPIFAFIMLGVALLIFGYYISGLFVLPGMNILNFKDGLIQIFTHPLDNWWNEKTPACLMLAFIIWLFIVSYLITYYRDFHMDVEHGSADWLEAEVASKELADATLSENRILSQNVKVSLRKGLSNNNLLIIGASGSFKTTSVVETNLLQFAASAIMLDVKGTTMQTHGNSFVKAGYKVNSLNFKSPELSDRYNPFVYIEREDDLLRVAKALQDSVRPPKEMSAADPFWDDGVRLYLQSLFYYVWLESRETGRIGTINDLLYLVNMENQKLEDGQTSQLQIMMDTKANKYGPEYPPVRDYRKLKEGAPETVGSIVLMVNSMLGICETAEMRRIFSGNDINIREMGTGANGVPGKKTICFLVSPDYNSPYNWVFAMFYTQVCDILMRASDFEIKKPLPIRVELWLDEFYAGAKPASPEVLAGVVRSRNICMNIIIQSISQLKATMGDNKWEILLDNMAAVVYLGAGPASKSTHEFISGLLGNTTMDSRTDNLSHSSQGGNSGLNYTKAKRELMTPDEVARIPNTYSIVLLEGRSPIIDLKAIPFDLKNTAGKYQAPAWLKEPYTKSLAHGTYTHPVHTVYDPVHLRYITVEQHDRIRIVEGRERETFLEAAKTDPRIFQFSIDETDLLYLNWNKKKLSKKEIEALFREVTEKETLKIKRYRSLAVLQDVDGIESFISEKKEPDKSDWDKELSLAQMLAKYWDTLTLPEQEEFALAMDGGMDERELKQLLMLPLEEMQQFRRTVGILEQENKA